MENGAYLQHYQDTFVKMATGIANGSHSRNHTSPVGYAKWASNPVNRGLVGVMCCLSILGSMTIMTTFVLWKELRTTSRKILLFLSISDLLLASSNLFGVLIPMKDNTDDPRNALCVAQSFLTTSFSIMSFLWTLTLAIYLYLAIVQNKQVLGKKLLPYFHILNWLLGPIINLIAWREGMLGYAENPITGGWCWIYHDTSHDTSTQYKISDKEYMWIVLDGKGLELIVYTMIFVFYGLIKCKLHTELKQQLQMPMDPEVLRAARSADRKLILVPILLFVGRSFGIIKLFMHIFSDHKPESSLSNAKKGLLTLEGIGDSSQGFLNFILFCFLNPVVSNHLKEAFLPALCCDPCKVKLETESGNVNGQPSFSIPETRNELSKPLLDDS